MGLAMGMGMRRGVRVVRGSGSLLGAPDDRGRERPPVSRARVVASVAVPVVLAVAIGSAVLPRALAARQASDDQAAAALAAATLPSGVLAVLDGGPREDLAPRSRALPVPVAVTLTVDAVAAPPAVDGAAPAAAVDTAAAQAEAVVALSSQGVVVTDGSTGIPVTVLAAYRKAEANLAAAKPSCHLPWWVLAGIGRIESGHASGGRVDADGTTRGRIVGIALDGSVSGTAVVKDTDGGRGTATPSSTAPSGRCSSCPARGGRGARTATVTGWPTPTTSSTRPRARATCCARPATSPIPAPCRGRSSCTTTPRPTWPRCCGGGSPTATA